MGFAGRARGSVSDLAEVATLITMRGPRRRAWRISVLALVVGYAVCMGLLAVFLRSSGDATPWGMLLLFAPRWVLLLPWLVLAPAAWPFSRRLAAGAVVAAVFTAFAVAGLEVPALGGAPPARRAVRLVTYNTDGSRILADGIRHALRDWRADVAVFQDCSSVLADSLRATVGDSVHVVQEYCIVSALPIRAIDTLPAPSAGAPRTSAVRVEVETSNGPLAVYGVHFASPRDEMSAARQLNFALLDGSIVARSIDSRRVAEWARQSHIPYVVAGDFNAPTGSAILRRDWAGLQDAFSQRGWGFGYTMFAGKVWVRIDHVFLSHALVTDRIVLPRGFPSDHQPVLVDVAWPSR